MSTAGEPIRKATVRLSGGGQPVINYVESSGPDGSFRFENVGPGRYTVSAQKQGFLLVGSGTLAVLVLSSENRSGKLRSSWPLCP